MIKFLKKGLFLPLLALLLLFNSCNLGDSDNNSTNGTTTPPQTGVVEEQPDSNMIDLKIIGTWKDQYGSEILFTQTHYYSLYNNSLSHSGEIYRIKEGIFSNNETPGTTGSYGFIIVKYIGGAGDGKFGVIRWKSYKTEAGSTTMSYSEGFSNNKYFETVDEAESGMTDNNNFFNFYSVLNKIDLPIVGTWNDQYGSELNFTDTHYNNIYNGAVNWSGEIYKIVINSFSNNELPGTADDYGYIVVKYTNGAGDGKFGVIRWKSLKTVTGVTTLEYSEGYNASGYFNSVLEAEEGMTDAASYFNFYSTVTKQ